MSGRGDSPRQRRIAVVGGGIAGIAAAHWLARDYDVTIFEAAPRLGGHAHSVELTNERGEAYSADTAFLIFNERTYPLFMQLLRELGVEGAAIPAEMSSCFDDPAIQFAYTLGSGLRPFLANPRVLADRRFHRVIHNLIRFRREAVRDIESKRPLAGMTAGEYLRSYDQHFVQNFVWPLTAAIWSLADGEMSDYPIATLLEYFDNHQLLRGRSDRKWRTFKNSSRVYVSAFERQFPGTIKTSTPVQGLCRTPNGVSVRTTNGMEEFDAVVLATHADHSLRLIESPTALEQQLLGVWRYKDNPVTLHRDTQVLHADARRWGSWNMRREQGAYRISYYLNRLQQLPSQSPLILSLGNTSAAEEKIIQRYDYHHPIFDVNSVASQARLPELNGKERLWFCGSYFGHGFHEDAVRSAAAVVRGLRSFE